MTRIGKIRSLFDIVIFFFFSYPIYRDNIGVLFYKRDFYYIIQQLYVYKIPIISKIILSNKINSIKLPIIINRYTISDYQKKMIYLRYRRKINSIKSTEI